MSKPSEVKANRNGNTGWSSNGSVHDDGTHQLADWTGSWAPAPADWDFRPAFDNAKQITANIELWLDTTTAQLKSFLTPMPWSRDVDVKGTMFRCRFADASVVAKSHKSPHPPASPKESKTAPHVLPMGEIVPRYWIPTMLDNQNPQVFWKHHPSSLPKPQHDDDLVGVQPWWEYYPSPTSYFHLPIVDDGPISIDQADETPQETRARKADGGSNLAAAQRRDKRLKKKNTLYATTSMADRERAPTIPARPANGERRSRNSAQNDPWASTAAQIQPTPGGRLPPLSQSFIPASPSPVNGPTGPAKDVTIREAVSGDVAQITAIYNHYVAHTVTVPELTPLDKPSLAARLTASRTSSLPFIVATKISCRTGPTSITGFAYATTHSAVHDMYRFTVRIHIFVSPSQLRSGHATSLLDKMLFCLDPDYIEREEHVTGGDELTLGARRRASKILLNVAWGRGQQALSRVHVQEKTKRASELWQTAVLARWGFALCGQMDAVGVKLGQWYVLCVPI